MPFKHGQYYQAIRKHLVKKGFRCLVQSACLRNIRCKQPYTHHQPEPVVEGVEDDRPLELHLFTRLPLIHASVGFFEIDLDKAQELEDIVFQGYLEGLSDAGWWGDPRQVRMGYTAASLRYRFMGGWLAAMLDENQLGSISQAFGLSVEEYCEYCAQVWTFIHSRTDEARVLMDILG